MEWNDSRKSRIHEGQRITESSDGRFYIASKRGYVSLYDTKNRLAGGVTCDSIAEAKKLAERIAQ